MPRLVVRWLRFTGTKKPTGKKSSPIDYAREFAQGVNVILIEDNLVGKSTILKTIKFALTGDDGDYDDDVKAWIKDVWLRFSLDDVEYTIMLARREDGLHGMLVPGKKECPIEDIPAGESSIGFRCKGADEIQEELKNFFVHSFRLASMGWTQAHPSGDGRSSECWATWRTFFQALRIPDDDHAYLLCKPDPERGDHLAHLLTRKLLAQSRPELRIGAIGNVLSAKRWRQALIRLFLGQWAPPTTRQKHPRSSA